MTDHQVRSYGAGMTTDNHPPATNHGPSATGPDPVPQYEIRVAGHLASRWSAWFDGLTIDTETEGTTVIRGAVVDQTALHGLIQRLRDVGIPLISVTPIPSTTPGEFSARPKQGEMP